MTSNSPPRRNPTSYHVATSQALSECFKRAFPKPYKLYNIHYTDRPTTVPALARQLLAEYMIANGLHCDFNLEDLIGPLNASVKWPESPNHLPEWSMTKSEIAALAKALGHDLLPQYYEPLPEVARVAFLRARRRHLALFGYTAAREGNIIYGMGALEDSFDYMTESHPATEPTDPALDGLF